MSSEDRVAAMEEYISSHHVDTITWHTTLNNTTSKRPKIYGGSVVPATTKCKTFERVATGSRCRLTLPNSFAPGDGLVLDAVGVGSSQNQASQNACRRALAMLLCANPRQVVLRPCHWAISIDDLMAALPGGGHQALPVHVRNGDAEAGQEGDLLGPDRTHARVERILREALIKHNGTFDPSYISHINEWDANPMRNVYILNSISCFAPAT
jgi:hypothetical protein